MPSVKLSELMDALEIASVSGMLDNAAYVSRTTGEVICVFEGLEDEQELPEDLDDPAKYLEVPHKHELDLGRRLVMRFVDQELPDSYDDVENIFRRKGAYSRYKALLERAGKLDAWYRFEEAETESALKEWAEMEGFDVIDDEGR